MVKFKVTSSIADISTFKMCCTWERREVASFSALFKGSLTAFPLWKVCTVKKGAEQDPTRTKCLQWITLNLSIHCHLTRQDTAPTHPCTAHTWVPCSQCMRSWKCTSQGRMWPPARLQIKIQPFPQCQMGWTLPNTGHALGKTQGRVWQCLCAGHQSLASPAHEECVGHRGTSWKRKENWTKHNSLKSGLRKLCLTGENFHQNAPPNDWQLHPRTQTRYKNTQAIPQMFIK